jgi:hypothetical protein
MQSRITPGDWSVLACDDEMHIRNFGDWKETAPQTHLGE